MAFDRENPNTTSQRDISSTTPGLVNAPVNQATQKKEPQSSESATVDPKPYEEAAGEKRSIESNVALFDHYTHAGRQEDRAAIAEGTLGKESSGVFSQTIGLETTRTYERKEVKSTAESTTYVVRETTSTRAVKPDGHILEGQTTKASSTHSGLADVTYKRELDKKGKERLGAEITLKSEHKRAFWGAKDTVSDVKNAIDDEDGTVNIDGIAERALVRSAERHLRKAEDYGTVLAQAKREKKSIEKAEKHEEKAEKAREEAKRKVEKAGKYEDRAKRESKSALKSWGYVLPTSDRWVDEYARFDDSSRFVTTPRDRFSKEPESTGTYKSAKERLSKEDLEKINEISQKNVKDRERRQANNTKAARENSEAIVTRDNLSKRVESYSESSVSEKEIDRGLTRQERKDGASAKYEGAKKGKKAEAKKAASKSAFASAFKAKRLLQKEAGDMSEKSADDLLRSADAGMLHFAKEQVFDLAKRGGVKAVKALGSLLSSLLSTIVSTIAGVICPIIVATGVPIIVISMIMILVILVGSFLLGESDAGDSTSIVSQGTEWGGDGITYYDPLDSDTIDDIISRAWDSYYTYEIDPSGYVTWHENMSYVQDQVIRYALSKVGSAYSQAYHFDKDSDIFDCSSLAYRCYRNVVYYGEYTGDFYYIDISNSGAYSAAEELKAAVNRDQLVYISKETLYPGDLIFWTGANNGRYLGTYHVAVYVGNGKMVEARNESSGVVLCDVRNFNDNVYAVRPYGNNMKLVSLGW